MHVHGLELKRDDSVTRLRSESPGFVAMSVTHEFISTCLWRKVGILPFVGAVDCVLGGSALKFT